MMKFLINILETFLAILKYPSTPCTYLGILTCPCAWIELSTRDANITSWWEPTRGI